MVKKLLAKGANETVTKCNGLKMQAKDRRMRLYSFVEKTQF